MAQLKTPYDKTVKLEKRIAWLRFLAIFAVLSPLGIALWFILVAAQFLIWRFTRIELPPELVIATAGLLVLWVCRYLAFYPIDKSKEAWNGSSNNDDLVYALGARPCSDREKDRFMSVLEDILARGSNVVVHDNWYVIDYPIPQAFTVGTDLFITREAITGRHLAPILAHELGHLHRKDGDKFKAVRSLVYPFIQFKTTNMTTYNRFYTEAPAKNQSEAIKVLDVELKTAFWAIVFGGFSLIYYAREWADFFKHQDFWADSYALKLGFGQELIDYLEEVQKTDMAVPFYASWIPYTELRIGQLIKAMETETIPW